MSQKGFANLLLVLIIILVVASGGFYLSKKFSPQKLSDTYIPHNTLASTLSSPSPSLVATPRTSFNLCPNEDTVPYSEASVKLDLSKQTGPQELSAAQKWRKDAYYVSSILFQGITEGPDPHSSDIFASRIYPNHYLIYGGFGSGPVNLNITPEVMSMPSNIASMDCSYDINQLSEDLPFSIQSDIKLSPDFTQPSENGPIIYLVNNPESLGGTDIKIEDSRFHADAFEVQVNNTKDQGIIYDVIFLQFGPDDTGYMKVAEAVISSTGKLVSLKQF